jgi:hypothetical protein
MAMSWVALVVLPSVASAVLEIGDRGPMLQTGRLALRVTNAGIFGNAFLNAGLSADPSFEFPAYSGRECLNFASLWVGAEDEFGRGRVSGGPLMEWRPTPDPEDRVRIRWRADPGTARLDDDDQDGRIDEEILDGRDDDGDGLVDEDLGLFAFQTLAADFTDDRPEAAYVSDGGERHLGLGLSVHQEVYGWTTPGYEGVAGIQFRIRNHGTRVLHQVYVGLFADLDSRLHGDGAGHLDDEVVMRSGSGSVSRGGAPIQVGSTGLSKGCIETISYTGPVVIDSHSSLLPAVTVMPLSHTTDPLAWLLPEYARAPAISSFRSSILLQGYPALEGGVPKTDAERYAALAGRLPRPIGRIRGDVGVLVSCGPFPALAPGEFVDFAVALVAGTDPDSVVKGMGSAARAHLGLRLNMKPDSTGPDANQWYVGETGLNGHESCIDVPPGVVFRHDPDCFEKFFHYGVEVTFPPDVTGRSVEYRHGHCVWTDADCDACTGHAGQDTLLYWSDPGEMPPRPTYRFVTGDGRIEILWDNLAEVLMEARIVGPRNARFSGYNLYRLNGWRGREGLLPPLENWSLIAAFDVDTTRGAHSLGSVVDSSVHADRVLQGHDVYPPGRYRYVDREVLNGFDYVYVVTTRAVIPSDPFVRRSQRFESPFVASFSDLVTPREEARDVHPSVWVVPNPFRGGASWDRPEIRGDVLTRHVDFMGMPRAHATIKIWTLAGDLVARIDHDGSGGDGQARWNLVSRSGQDVASGIYLFTVESPLGSETGRFVIMR